MEPLASPALEAVSRHYDQLGPFYATVWGDNLHMGMWDGHDDDSPLPEAQNRLTDLLIDLLRVKPQRRVLDLGCGVGLPATRLARQTGCGVLGISTNRVQVWLANQRAQREQLADRVFFQWGDAQALPCDDESFDAAWAIETLSQLADPAAALRAVARALVPGGHLALADLVERAPLSDADRALLSQGLALHSLGRADDLQRALAEAGLELTEQHAGDESLARTALKTGAAIRGRRAHLCAIYGAENVALLQERWSAIERVFRREALSYVVLVARKPEV